jgi:hypothetical protein
MPLKLRQKNLSTIEYILVAEHSPLSTSFIPPEALMNEVVDFIKECPTDLFQFVNPMDYFEDCQRHLWYWGFDLNVFYDKDYKHVKQILDESKQIQLIFLNNSIPEHLKILKDLNSSNKKYRYFYFYPLSPYQHNLPYKIKNPDDFINLLNESSEVLIKDYGFKENFNISVEVVFKDLNVYKHFTPTKTNYYLLNRIVGNFGGGWTKNGDNELGDKLQKKAEQADKVRHSFVRQNLFIDQIKKIDFFPSIAYQKDVIKAVHPIDPILNPLILVIPFHNPDLKNIYKNREITRALQVEQTANYINLIDSGSITSLTINGIQLLAERTKFLDDVAFLHSSLTFSPVIRFPIKGESIFRELSFFRTHNFTNLCKPKTRQKLKQMIHSFGTLYLKNCISHEVEELIRNRNGQLIFISDLPIEWIPLKGIPISFTHDICRLPETSLGGLLSFYMHNKTTEFSVSNNILDKTLVIFGNAENNFKIWQDQVINLSKEKNFLTRTCVDLKSLKEEIQLIKPDLIIFDCHGGYDESDHSTYLFIGNEKLTGDYIVNNNITAPLVFLSACGTAPTYGTINTIANAFFEAGALSVTTTYIPISIQSGSILYLRILNNLDYASRHPIHKNWLAFLAHIIRTSSINDAFFNAMINNEEMRRKYASLNTKILTELMQFSKRREIYRNLDEIFSEATGSNSNIYTNIIPEYLLYSNMGRSDLILFDSWKERFLNINVC